MNRPPKLLMIANESTDYEAIADILRPDGYEITAIGSHEAALQSTDQSLPDMILVYEQNTISGGSETCRQLRRKRRFSNLPIICITNGIAPEQTSRIFEDGADDHITREMYPDQFRALVKTRIERTWLYKQSSPLTGLPGNPVVERELQRRIANMEPVAVAYIDIDSFKSFNDHYGWLQGDEVIRLTARIILENVDHLCGEECFLGHLGGDDFVAIMPIDLAEPFAASLIKEFDRRIPELYSRADQEQGSILQYDRTGNLNHFPFLTISVAICANSQRELLHPEQVVQITGRLKKKLKSVRGSSYMIESGRGDP